MMVNTGDDDRTRLATPSARTKVSSSQVASTSAPDFGQESVAWDESSLPAGTVIGSYKISEKIGEGGFGVVYLAWDQLLHQKVALKEYLPSDIAGRRGTTQISLRSERHRETFDRGLESFIDEARRMVQFDHPSLARAITFLEANGTAYIVMPFYEGVNLRDTVMAQSTPPDEVWLKSILRPLTEALGVIHARDFYHRDIAPDNIMLLVETGRPLLLDFGAARQAFSEKTQALTTILKPGFAPLEQYGEVPGLKQGPWTDIYALAAVIHWAITRTKPPQPVGRMVNDTYIPLATAAAGRYSNSFLEGVDKALAVLPDKRTRDIAAFRRDLGLDVVDTPALVNRSPEASADPDATIVYRPRSIEASPRPTAASPSLRDQPRFSEVANAADRANKSRGSSALKPWMFVVVGVGALGAGVAWWASQPTPVVAPTKAPTSAPPPQPTVPPVATPPPPVVDAPPKPSPQIETPPPPTSPPAVEELPPRAPSRPGIEKNKPEPVKRSVTKAPAEQTPPSRNQTSSEDHAKTKPSGGQASPECASLLQRISLGDADPSLIQRYKTLGCR